MFFFICFFFFVCYVNLRLTLYHTLYRLSLFICLFLSLYLYVSLLFKTFKNILYDNSHRFVFTSCFVHFCIFSVRNKLIPCFFTLQTYCGIVARRKRRFIPQMLYKIINPGPGRSQSGHSTLPSQEILKSHHFHMPFFHLIRVRNLILSLPYFSCHLKQIFLNILICLHFFWIHGFNRQYL